MHDKLVPPVLTPNSFELGWLAGRPVTTLADVRTAAALGRGRAPTRLQLAQRSVQEK